MERIVRNNDKKNQTVERISLTIAIEQSLRHEGEVLAAPDVAVIHRTHEDVGKANSDILVDLGPVGRVMVSATPNVLEEQRSESCAYQIGIYMLSEPIKFQSRHTANNFERVGKI